MLLRKPIASIILVLAVLIFGGLSLSRLSIELLPDVTQPTLLISTTYTGAPANEVEFRINEQLEGVLSSIRGVDHIQGIARQGQSLIFLTFNWGSDMDIAFLNVREKLDQARYLLPQQAGRPQLIYSSASDEPIATIALKSGSDSDSEMNFQQQLDIKRWAEQVFTRRLEQQDGIAQAILVGAVIPEVQIQFSPNLLDRYGINLAQVQQAVQQANVFSPGGELRDGWYRYALKVESRIQSIEDIEDIPVVALASGRVLKLNEIATINLTEADPTSFSLLDNQSILTIQVKKEYGANTVAVFQTLAATIDQIQSEQPDFTIQIIAEDATYIQNSISNLLQTLVIGGFLAFLILFLFLNDARSPFTIGISIPVSIFLTFIVMFLLDIQLNIISLSGLTLGIGLLLDNAIVVLDNINRYRKQGFDRFEAAKKGTREISLAVTASTFTTISVFLPLLFLGGFEGAFFRDLAATLSISLLSSLAVALVLLPVFVAHFSGDHTMGWMQIISNGLDNIIQKYEQSLQNVLQKPIIMLFSASLLMMATIWMFMIVPKAALPQSEPERIETLITLQGNSSLKSAKEAATSITGFIQSNSSSEHIHAIGGYTDNISIDAIRNEGMNKIKLSVPVENQQEIVEVERVIHQLAETFERWRFELLSDNGLGLVSTSVAPVEFNFVGTDRALSRRVATAFNSAMSTKFPNLELTEKYPQRIQTFEIQFDGARLLDYELTQNELIQYLESITRGSWISDWNRQDEQIAIRMVGQKDEALHPNEMMISIKNKRIPLSDLAQISVADEAVQLERSAQSAILSYQSNLSFVDWWWQADEIKELIQQFTLQTGYEVRVTGSAPSLITLLQELGLLLLLSVLIIYLILAIQYEHLIYPLLIILAIPFAWVGSIIILFVTGLSLNALSFMGILILTGIAVNDSILKVDFMRRYFDETGNLEEAIRQAGKHRFRPVVMTSLTTILGLIPMLIPFGDGFVFRQSLAIALMGGMITSTILTLYLIPFAFKLINQRTLNHSKST